MRVEDIKEARSPPGRVRTLALAPLRTSGSARGGSSPNMGVKSLVKFASQSIRMSPGSPGSPGSPDRPSPSDTRRSIDEPNRSVADPTLTLVKSGVELDMQDLRPSDKKAAASLATNPGDGANTQRPSKTRRTSSGSIRMALFGGSGSLGGGAFGGSAAMSGRLLQHSAKGQ